MLSGVPIVKDEAMRAERLKRDALLYKLGFRFTEDYLNKHGIQEKDLVDLLESAASWRRKKIMNKKEQIV